MGYFITVLSHVGLKFRSFRTNTRGLFLWEVYDDGKLGGLASLSLFCDSRLGICIKYKVVYEIVTEKKGKCLKRLSF